MNSKSLLIELGTEELPPTALRKLSEAFSASLLTGLLESELIHNQQKEVAQSFATPRRLALLIPDVQAKQPDQENERRGPATAAAFNDAGEPTPAAQGFAKSCGVTVDDLQRIKTDKGEWLSYTVKEVGKSLQDLVGPILDTAIKQLPIPKRMRWGNSTAEFVRPVHWLVVMHGEEVIPSTVLELHSGSISRGHRFHSDGNLQIDHADNYADLLLNGGSVVASFAQRQKLIKEQITTLANSLGAVIEDDQELLDEVTGLVEKPVALLGSFDVEFLEVPSECLISAMRDHQKYFHLTDKAGKLLPNFITVSNIQSKDPQRVTAGNERVINARLSDARFFWDTDRKQPLSAQLPKLSAVTFHAKLGSMDEKSTRLKALSKSIADEVGANSDVVVRAAELAKADLVTDMVGEFDKLQGVMGHYYADRDGEVGLVGECIEQHYWPRFSGDHLPSSKEAQVLALADRLDSLVGIYGAGEIPSGDKDPYSLRRASLGILRILIERQLPLSLSALVSNSAATYAAQKFDVSQSVQDEIVAFIRSRLTAYYQGQGVATNAINAVLTCNPDRPLDFDQRLQAVRRFNELDEAADLAAANKRINNILKKQQSGIPQAVSSELLVEPAEVALHAALSLVEESAGNQFDAGNYSAGLREMASLRSPVDDFFETVMVMSEDPDQQANRLALLARMRALFLRVADIALLQS